MKNKFRAIVAVLASVMMLCTVLPMTVSAAAGDVVLNLNFDGGVDGFASSSYTPSTVDGALVFDATGADWANVYLGGVGIQANTDYKVTFKAKANKAASLNFKVNDSWVADAFAEAVDVTTDWQEYELTVNCAELGWALVMFTSSYAAADAAIYYIDDLKIVEAADAALIGKLVNGDFETGDNTGWETHQSTTIDAAAAQSGAYGAHLIGNGGWGGMLNQTVFTTPGKNYEITLSFKVIANGVNIQIKSAAGNVLDGGWFDANAASEWTTKTFVVTAEDESIMINFCGGGNGVAEEVYVDDISVIAPSFDGFVTNGDFETGNAAGWEILQGSTIDAAAAQSGNYGAHLIGNGSWGGMLDQAFATEAGKSYEITMSFKVINNGVNIQVKSAAGNNLSGGWFDANAASEWTTKTFLVTAEDESLLINFCGAGNGVSEEVYVDNISVLELKDPSFDGYITNGDFETGKTDSWDPVWWAQNISIVEGRNGGSAMQFNGGMYQLVRQKVSVKPNTNYVVSVYAKDASTVTLLVKDGNDSGNIKQAGINTGSDWTKVSLEFNSGDWNEVYVAIMGNVDGSSVVVDDFHMFEKPDASNDGYIINGNFETGDLQPWDNLWGSCPKAEVVKGGMDSNWALEIVSGQWKHVRQTNIAVEANTNYKISVWVKNAKGMSLLVKDGGDSVDIVNQGIEAGDEWTLFSIEFNTGDYTSIIFSLMGNNAEEAFGTFDNVVMEKIESNVIYGDANGDGSVNNLDVALLQRFLNNWEVTVDEASADANGDGSVNNLDVALLQRFLNNWEVTLGPV